jgi:hypothetical protein
MNTTKDALRSNGRYGGVLEAGLALAPFPQAIIVEKMDVL